MGKRRAPELYRAPFPLYTVKIHPQTGLIITAGGGGASKTGIKNAMHFLSLDLVGGLHSATLLHTHETDTRATMCMSLGGDVIAAGQDANCSLMRFSHHAAKQAKKPAAKDGAGDKGAARKRGGKGQNGDGGGGGGDVAQTKEDSPQMLVEDVGAVQADLSPQDPCVKCVRFSADLTLLLSGGADGYVRVWEFPSLKEKFSFRAHKDELEDIDISPDNKHIVTVGRDFECSVWSGDQLAVGLCWHENMPQITEKMYRYKSCRFAKVEDQKDDLRLYTVQIPHKRDRKPPPCYITKWDGRVFLPLLTKPCGNEVLCCLAVSDSGTFLGLGTVTGSVAIYIAFSLQKLYYIQESHGIVVTDLTFLPDAPKSKAVKGNNEVVMLSVAVDSRCQVHAVSNRRSFPLWLVLFFCGLMVVGVILLLQSLFPAFI
ncbi:prolactin regulatory element-binding protein-like [Sinocyclocheilus rhinocerous]|uniref:Prolactin regulatory element-binding protein-like n=1 Tax=Sinocyclocheilus rhinocerous TaxID=307959 RepID=A0A673JRY6_9TELE|nr:PREDICTED: prolactin regulatory element-binding protein-like [Sinocyclocheilus rhinocerous]XP_016403912.1 PREDICTED: prolactin regulatory element-binding protein-like [Sinocyclocheilus rhinocerous]XP_016403913.1 PREDICTED: prolactin regulatory element-binding protein-like [Sinocyclocheilus rhinocerous]XP_016403914.1 PREDICTED: prolactin regulatory element-binding protein-like [Sinocyclocheilus rhinocerous]